jgi:hypothetical protein
MQSYRENKFQRDDLGTERLAWRQMLTGLAGNSTSTRSGTTTMRTHGLKQQHELKLQRMSTKQDGQSHKQIMLQRTISDE